MALNKNKLKARMTAKSPTTTPAQTIPLTNLTAVPEAKPFAPNGTPTPLKSVPKRKRAKDGTTTTSRYSFEITGELKGRLEQAIINHRKATGNNISNSAVIRTALDKYLKGGKL